jgi:hypothetical protein
MVSRRGWGEARWGELGGAGRPGPGGNPRLGAGGGGTGSQPAEGERGIHEVGKGLGINIVA